MKRWKLGAALWCLSCQGILGISEGTPRSCEGDDCGGGASGVGAGGDDGVAGTPNGGTSGRADMGSAGDGDRGGMAGAGSSGGTDATGGVPPGTGGVLPGTGGSGASGGDAGTSGEAGMAGRPMLPVAHDGLLLWLTADRGVVVEDGGVVEWADQSGQSRDATQPELELRPTFVDTSQPSALVFDGVDDYLILPEGFTDFTNGLSLFLVVESDSFSGSAAFIELSNGPETHEVTFGRSNGGLYYEIVNDQAFGEVLAAGSPHVVTLVHRADESVEFHRNGMPFGSGESRLPEVTGRIENSLGRSQYGDFRYFPGRLTELVLYNRALPEEDARSIEAYLAEHWDCCTD